MEYPILGQIRTVSKWIPMVSPILLIYYDLKLKKRESLEKALDNRGADILFSIWTQTGILKLIQKVVSKLPPSFEKYNPSLYINNPISTATLFTTSLIRDYPESMLLRVGGLVYTMATIVSYNNQVSNPQIAASVGAGVLNSFILNKLFLTIAGTFSPFD